MSRIALVSAAILSVISTSALAADCVTARISKTCTIEFGEKYISYHNSGPEFVYDNCKSKPPINNFTWTFVCSTNEGRTRSVFVHEKTFKNKNDPWSLTETRLENEDD